MIEGYWANRQDAKKRPTRYYSSRQEKRVAKVIGGRQVSNSGAPPFVAGDVTSDYFLIECKTKTQEVKSVSIYKHWLEKNQEEAFAMNKPYSALAFDFGDGENYFVIDERTFKHFNKLLKEAENG